MQTPFDQTDADARLDDSLALLRELEANKPDEIRQQRADERKEVQEQLTSRELQVLKLAARGMTNRKIAGELSVSASWKASDFLCSEISR